MMHFKDDGLGCWPADTFDFKVDLLVTSLYKAALNEIDTWDCEQKQQFQMAQVSSSEEGACQIEYWNGQVAPLSCW